MSTPTIETKYGPLQGVHEDGLTVFKGIPYAAPPAGARRFRPPQPPEPWSSTRVCDTFGPLAYQPPPLRSYQGDHVEQGDDCLSLNVWTPACDDKRRPVMVWIHGGAFVTGSGSMVLYRGNSLAERGDVVVVTINYRLGALGFLAHPDLRDGETGAAGNWGLLDQIAALEWVADHIERFGGDPSNVTIFGESAGSMSVSTLLGTPRAKGLFAKAVAQSGGPAGVPLDEAAEITERLLQECNVDDFDALRELPVEELLAAQGRITAGRLPWMPCVDGATVPEAPIKAIAGGLNADVPLLVGTNRDEMKYFSMGRRDVTGADEAKLLRLVSRTLGEKDAPHAIEAYRRARAERGESTEPFELWSAIESDRVFRVNALRMADAHSAAGAPVYDYLFTWESPAVGGTLGSCHALEIPFVFGTLVKPGVDLFTGGGPEAVALIERMQAAWLAFARTGDPGWPTYQPGRKVQVYGATDSLEEAPYEAERAWWEGRDPGRASALG